MVRRPSLTAICNHTHALITKKNSEKRASAAAQLSKVSGHSHNPLTPTVAMGAAIRLAAMSVSVPWYQKLQTTT